MKYKRKSSMMVRMAALLFVTMMFTMCFVGGTFAKYTSSATGTDSAAVAKWSIKVNTADIATAGGMFTFDLFNTVKDSDLSSNETDMNPVDGSIIAPGTSGKFDIVIKNESQVNATYSIDYTVENDNNIPVQFSTDGTNWKTNINDLDVSDVAINMSATETVTVYWKWDYYVGAAEDAIDTTLGTTTPTPGLYVHATVTATQVD